MQRKNSLKPIYLAIAAFIVVIVVISLLFASGIFHKNHLGNEIKINNFTHYFKNTPTDTKDSIFAGLYNIVNTNSSDDIDLTHIKDSAIRKDSSTQEYAEDTETTTGTFIVDIPSIEQSYRVQFHWSTDPAIIASTGYTNIISCLPESEMIYPAFSCKDFFNQDPFLVLLTKYPILNKLPLQVAFYSNNYSSYTNYEITYQTAEDLKSFSIIINDYTGGNRENALQKIRELGFNPSDYTIQYVNKAQNIIPSRAPNDYK